MGSHCNVPRENDHAIHDFPTFHSLSPTILPHITFTRPRGVCVCVCVWAVIAIYAGNYWQCEGRKARIFARPNHENESYHSAGCGVGRERPFYPTLFLLVSLFILLQVTITTVVEYRSEVETEVCLGQVYLLLLTVCDIKVKFVVGLSS